MSSGSLGRFLAEFLGEGRVREVPLFGYYVCSIFDCNGLPGFCGKLPAFLRKLHPSTQLFVSFLDDALSQVQC